MDTTWWTPLIAAAGVIALGGCHAGDHMVRPEPVPETEIALSEVRHLRSDGHFFISGVVTPKGLSALHARGVEAVVDLRLPEQIPEGYAQQVRDLGMTYVAVPMHSDGVTFETAEAALKAVESHADWPLLIQCASGNRSGAIYGVYRAAKDDLEPEEALKLAREAGMRNEQLAADVRRFLAQRAASSDD